MIFVMISYKCFLMYRITFNLKLVTNFSNYNCQLVWQQSIQISLQLVAIYF